MLKMYEAKIDEKFIMKTWGKVYDFMKTKYTFFKSMTCKAFYLSLYEIKSNELDTKKKSAGVFSGNFCQCRCRHVQTTIGEGTQKKLLERVCEKLSLEIESSREISMNSSMPV